MFLNEAQPQKPVYKLINLLKTCYPSLMNTAFSKMRHYQDAQDTVQETCERIARYYSGHLEQEPEIRQLGYIWVTFHHVLNDNLKKRRRSRTVPLDESIYEIPDPGAEIDISKILKPMELLDQIVKGLHITQEVKTMLILTGVYNLNTKEVAGLLKINHGTVRTALSRAKRLIREAYGAEMEKGAEHEEARV